MMQNEIQMARRAGEELVQAVTQTLAELTGQRDSPPAPDLCAELAAYAWEGTPPGPSETSLQERLHEIAVLVELLGGTLITPAGDSLMSPESASLIIRLANAATARDNIDEGDTVTIEQLAALARVTERTVRGATSTTNPDPLPIIKVGHWTYIEAKDALAWLSKRRDFQPTQKRERTPNVMSFRAAQPVGALWHQWRSAAELSIEELAQRLQWDSEQISSYRQLEEGATKRGSLDLSPTFWRDLALSLGATQPEEVARLTYQHVAQEYARQRVTAELAHR